MELSQLTLNAQPGDLLHVHAELDLPAAVAFDEGMAYPVVLGEPFASGRLWGEALRKSARILASLTNFYKRVSGTSPGVKSLRIYAQYK